MSNILEFIYSEIPGSKGRIDDNLSISANEIGTLIARYCESQKSAIPIVRLSSLTDDWFNKQVEYEKVASESDSWQHQVRFNAKAQATRDCWKELQRIIEDEA